MSLILKQNPTLACVNDTTRCFTGSSTCSKGLSALCLKESENPRIPEVQVPAPHRTNQNQTIWPRASSRCSPNPDTSLSFTAIISIVLVWCELIFSCSSRPTQKQVSPQRSHCNVLPAVLLQTGCQPGSRWILLWFVWTEVTDCSPGEHNNKLQYALHNIAPR